MFYSLFREKVVHRLQNENFGKNTSYKTSTYTFLSVKCAEQTCQGFQKLHIDLNSKNWDCMGFNQVLCFCVMVISLVMCGNPNTGRKYGSDSFA